jgi:hypothetical protein
LEWEHKAPCNRNIKDTRVWSNRFEAMSSNEVLNSTAIKH